ncbi:hypothetical protein JXB11_00315 [Candidatus Woesearchaeota archaeon]|nr:hypothetical protein [Candidatus Woesearchaeota archaeon]
MKDRLWSIFLALCVLVLLAAGSLLALVMGGEEEQQQYSYATEFNEYTIELGDPLAFDTSNGNYSTDRYKQRLRLYD